MYCEAWTGGARCVSARILTFYSRSQTHLDQERCCSPFRIPVVRGMAGRDYRRLYLRLFFPHFSLTTSAINSFKLFLSFALVLRSSSTTSRSFLARSSHRILDLPRLIFLFTFWPSYLFVIFSFPQDRLISTDSSPISS